VGQPDAWGGRLSVATGAFNVIRDAGTTTQRADLQLGWRRPFKGPVGDLWTVSLNVDSAAYAAHGLTKIPNYAPISRAVTQQAMPTLSIDGRWPLVRTAGNWGSQVVEPIVKLSASPRSRSYADGRIPNEDSLDFDFTDANLFERNRFTGIDRMEGGLRAAVGLHAAWMFPGGAQVDGLFGQSYRDRTEQALANSTGLRGTVSDYVGRISLSPVPWLDITNRERFDHDTEQVKLSDTTLSVGDAQFGIGAGYIYSSTSPYNSYDSSPTDPAIIAAVRKPRHEIALNGRARIDENWRSSAKFVRDLRLGKVSLYGMGATYEDECFIFDVSMYRRYTSMNSDHGDSGLLFNITLKSVGEFGFHAN
jgi:LPS-assembly protein